MYQQVKLDELCVHKIETISSDENGLIDYFDIASVDNTKKKIISHQSLKIEEAPSRAKQIVQLNDILVSTVRPNLNAVTIIDNETKNKMVASTGFCVLRASEKLEPRYLFYFVQSPTFINSMTAQATGASYPAVSNSIVKSSHIPLPDLPTQRRIADTLDKVSEGIEVCRKMLGELDLMVKAKFREMLETDYSEKTATEVCTAIVDCPHSTPTYSGCELLYPAIRTSEISNGKINWNSMKYVSADEYRMRVKKLMPQPGDIVYAREGTYGDCVILPAGFSFCLGQRTMLFRPNIDIVNPIYLHQVLRSNYVKRQADKSNTGSTVPHVNVADAKQFHFPLPPIEVQNRFADFSTKINESKLTIRGILDKMETEKLALMQGYFG